MRRCVHIVKNKQVFFSLLSSSFSPTFLRSATPAKSTSLLYPAHPLRQRAWAIVALAKKTNNLPSVFPRQQVWISVAHGWLRHANPSSQLYTHYYVAITSRTKADCVMPAPAPTLITVSLSHRGPRLTVSSQPQHPVVYSLSFLYYINMQPRSFLLYHYYHSFTV